ncbi:MAG: DUF4258 domain-containing protein [Candidatus Omnitrophica bacterium]|nr:DUF4258 domain-containing protein [Candidatus Omnitrophota bacterium]
MPKKKKIILTKHAQERMNKRNVTLDDIRTTIEHPTNKLPIAKDNTQEFKRKVDNKETFVVVEHKGKEVLIITVGWS